MPEEGGGERAPEDDLRIARQALDSGDLSHALTHIAAALSHDPLRREWLDVLDRIILEAPDPLALVPMDDTPLHFAMGAARAYLLANDGQYEEAVRLLLSVAEVKPEAPYLEWARDWLEAPGVAETVEPALVAQWLWRWVEREPERRDVVLSIADRASASRPDDADLHLVRSSILRRCGRLHDALSDAEAAHRLVPGRMTAFMIGVSLRSLGRPAVATIDWYRRALEYEPADVPVRLDLADLLLEEDRLDEAAETYDEVLALEPTNGWARASRAYVAHLLDPHGGWVDELRALASSTPRNERAETLLAAIGRIGAAYVDYLPEPADATTNLLRSLVEKSGDAPKGKLKIRLNLLEAPSTRLALAHYERDGQLTVTMVVEGVPSPDPRRALAGGTSLWRYKGWPRQGTEPSPAIDPPPPAVVDAVAAIAAMPYRLDVWRLSSDAAARTMGEAALASLQAVMVHPPPPPAGAYAWVWISKVQVAAALILGRLNGGLAALLSLARGPIDWTTTAAIVALTECARRDPAIADDVRAVFTELQARIPETGDCCYEMALACNWQRLPRLTPDETAALRKWQQRLEAAK